MARNMYTIHSVTHSHTLHRGTRARICWVAWYTDLGGKKDGTVSFVMSCLFPPPLVLSQDTGLMKRAERLCDTVLRLESFAASEKKKNPAFRDYTGEKLSLAASMFKGAAVVCFLIGMRQV